MRLTRFSTAALVLIAACSGDATSPVVKAGPPASVVADAPASLAGRAGATLSNVVLKVRDASGRGVSGQAVAFEVTQGGGTLAAMSGVSGVDGTVTLPAWTLGKSASAQTVRVTAGPVTSEVSATVQSAYDLDVRFFGAPVSAQHQALFTNAAARVRAIITSDLVNVAARDSVGGPLDLATSCGVRGLPGIAETIDDVVIFAAVDSIDGRGKVLAQAGPCLVRTASFGRLTVVGVMSFDRADIDNLASGGRLQDVITHEMLHVLGIGTLWRTRNFLVDPGLETVSYRLSSLPSQALTECQTSIGGGSVCASGIPVENTGGPGTRDGHWRESVFDNELMTGFAESGPMPISLMTIGALADLGYGINRDASDTYTVPPATMAMSARASAEPREGWEQELSMNLWEISPGGTRTLLRPKARSR